MLIDHPPRRPRPVISPSFLFHLSYPSTPSPFFLRISSQLRASSLAFYRVGVAGKLPRRIVSSSLLSTFLPSFFFLSPQDFQFSPPLRTPRFFDPTRARIFSFGITRASSSSCSSKKIYKIVRSVFWSVSRDLEGAPSSFRPPIEARADHRQPSAVTNGDVRR